MKRSQNIETFFIVKKKKKSATGAGDSDAEMCVRDEHEQQSSLSIDLSANQGMYKYAETI